jgi:hypothetical protein
MSEPQPQPHLSLNGTPGTLWEIRRQENIHPYLGLRQAILIINTQEKALKTGRISQKKAIRDLGVQKEKLSTDTGIDLEILLDEIDLAEYNLAEYNQLILDAETELQVAIREKQRIESLNPAMFESTYQELQEIHAKDAFQFKLARAVVVSAYSSHKMISEGAAEVIYDAACLSQADRERFEIIVVQQLKQLMPEMVQTQALNPTNGDCNGTSLERN